jgi:hypothetical protein
LVFFCFLFRFGFFSFLLIKPKPNRTGLFFQNFNRFNLFFSVWFFQLFFFRFSHFNRFFDFFFAYFDQQVILLVLGHGLILGLIKMFFFILIFKKLELAFFPLIFEYQNFVIVLDH